MSEKPIERIYVWTNDKGGVVASGVLGLGIVPFFFSELDVGGAERQKYMRQVIEQAAKTCPGETFRLVEFHRHRVVETVP